MEFFLLKDLLVIFAFSIVVLLVGHRLRIPPVVGFILTGVLAGPHGFGLIGEIKDVDTLAEIGIILLLFGIGMEFSLKKLMQIKRLFLLGGALQVGLTILITFCIILLFDRSVGESVFLGCLICMSSTAIVIAFLDKTGESMSPHGKLSIAILIFQDMVAIPMILLTPFLGNGGEHSEVSSNSALIWSLIKGLLILGTVFVCAQRFVPRLLLQVARTRNKELFLLCVLALCFGVAFLTSGLGLSLTIGAFLAGLIISESEYSHEAISNIFPLQALFISFFFVSVGMLLDIRFLTVHLLAVIGLTLAVLALKMGTGLLTTLLMGFPVRTAAMVAILLGQIGEFSFVLAQTGIAYGLGSDFHYQMFLCVSLLTLMVSPVLMNFAPRIAEKLSKLPFPDFILLGRHRHSPAKPDRITGHVIIAGFGVSGRNLARSCKQTGIPYLILEMNPDTVRDQKLAGEPIYFGDAAQLSNLLHLNVAEAKVIAVLINDPIAAQRIIKIARNGNPEAYIISRARFVQETPFMIKLGADEAIPDEFGTSVEILSRVLRQYYIPDPEIYSFIEKIRTDGYETLRQRHPLPGKLSEMKMNLSNVETASFRLKGNSVLIGKTLAESQLRQQYGMTVILVKRGEEHFSNPPPDLVLNENDVIVVIGEKISFEKSASFFGNYSLGVAAT